jgi:hypothetical protein
MDASGSVAFIGNDAPASSPPGRKQVAGQKGLEAGLELGRDLSRDGVRATGPLGLVAPVPPLEVGL